MNNKMGYAHGVHGGGGLGCMKMQLSRPERPFCILSGGRWSDHDGRNCPWQSEPTNGIMKTKQKIEIKGD